MRFRLGALGGLVAAVALCAWGCGDDGGVSCGPGTVRVGSTCIADSTGGDPMGGGDASVGDPGGGGGGGPTGGGGGGSTVADAGSGFGTEPPVDGGGTFSGPPGCDMAAGECDTWESELLDGLRARQAAAGCSEMLVADDRVDAVAERHAEHQATVDHLDTTSPDGDLFDQVADEGVDFRDAAAAFSVTRSGAEDVLTRWEANPSVAPLITRCGYMTGVGIHTSASDASYVTLLMVKM